MFNNNYWKMRAYCANTVPPTSYAQISIGVKDKSGNAVTNGYVISGNTVAPYFSSMWNYAIATRLIVGTGDTEATANDVDLESSAMSSLSNVSFSYICGADDDQLTTVFSLSASNETSSDIVITEVGLETGISDSNYDEVKILTAREVLKNPITIPAGGSKVITITAVNK